MLNRYQEKRREQWIKLNSFKKNEAYVKKILNKFGFIENESFNSNTNNTFNFSINCFGDYDICLINNKGKSYRITMNEDELSYKILEENLASNKTHKSKYHEVKAIRSDDAMIDVMRYLTSKDVSRNN